MSLDLISADILVVIKSYTIDQSLMVTCTAYQCPCQKLATKRPRWILALPATATRIPNRDVGS